MGPRKNHRLVAVLQHEGAGRLEAVAIDRLNGSGEDPFLIHLGFGADFTPRRCDIDRHGRAVDAVSTDEEIASRRARKLPFLFQNKLEVRIFDDAARGDVFHDPGSSERPR